MYTERATDIDTDTPRLEDEREQQTETRRDHAWTLVHDLRQPMTLISGHAQLARKHLRTNPERAEVELSEVVLEIGRIDRMLNDVLADLRRAASQGTSPETTA